jgi:hypothetical protein
MPFGGYFLPTALKPKPDAFDRLRAANNSEIHLARRHTRFKIERAAVHDAESDVDVSACAELKLGFFKE